MAVELQRIGRFNMSPNERIYGSKINVNPTWIWIESSHSYKQFLNFQIIISFLPRPQYFLDIFLSWLFYELN